MFLVISSDEQNTPNSERLAVLYALSEMFRVKTNRRNLLVTIDEFIVKVNIHNAVLKLQ